MKIVVTGATGFIGSRLVERLQAEGHTVVVLTRSPARAHRIFPAQAFPKVEVVSYDPMALGDWQQALVGCDGVVNLAGAPIADQRWTREYKQEILNSRQGATRTLVAAIANANPRPSVLVSASAIGYYGTSETATFEETSPAGTDFLAEVCQEWEAAAQEVTRAGVRLVITRIGIVVGNGGAIAKMLMPFRLFIGGPLGKGSQWFSWIHRDDLAGLILMALSRPDISGVLNATAPNPVRMTELCQTLGTLLQRPSWLPVPAFALELLLGDAAKLVLEGQKVIPKRAQELGFQYQYPTIADALAQVIQE
ncbi:MAG: TIGR01777 family oxidoreductase [Cyanobacteria bacterium]|nr:TIGR01777 family oxidoreductase [Cyanobacteriota bacterium]MDW8200873.1 TIGR01777 family oxidoreductase [Cyanobacteriota bacterium SKYGB_h_bin112]